MSITSTSLFPLALDRDLPRAPLGLESYLDSLPFLGRVSSSLTETEAGSLVELRIDYLVGAAGLADGGWLKLAFRFYSDWAPLQTRDPAGANYLTANLVRRPVFPGETDSTARELKIRYDQKGHERPFQKAVIIDVIDGFLKPGDVVEIRLGDRRYGGPGTRVQTFVEDQFRLRGFVDTAGTSRAAEVPGDVVLRLMPGKPDRLRVIGPRLVRAGEPAPVVVRAEDRWGNVCEHLRDDIDFGLRHPDGSFEQHRLAWTNAPWSAVRRILTLVQPGDYLVEAEQSGGRVRGCARLTVDATSATPRAWFADLHVHANDTVGTNSREWNFGFARDASGLDVLGYTANDFQIASNDWQSAVTLARQFNQSDEFVVFAGVEWCGASAAGGDHNVIFLDDAPDFPLAPDGGPARSFEWHEHLTSRRPEPGRWPLSRLHAAYVEDAERVLTIPHIGGRRALLDWYHPQLDRLIEVASSWGHFDWFYREALARGCRIGVSAAGDEHRGRPGGGAPGVSIFGVQGGLTGVLAARLDRDTVASALRARHTWATTGGRQVALLWADGAVQGDEITTEGALDLHYRVLGDQGWEWVGLYDHEGLIAERDLHREVGYSSHRLRLRWGGARHRDRYRQVVWQGRLRVEGSRFSIVRVEGLEHPEETIRREGDDTVVWSTETYGDADHVEIELRDPVNARIFVETRLGGYNQSSGADVFTPWPVCPHFHWNFTWKETAGGVLRRELPGEETFIAAERVTAEPLPLEVAGTWSVTPRNGPHGFRPVYLHARERDDRKVWTSPLFITFPGESGDSV